jgi:hypothetical protein
MWFSKLKHGLLDSAAVLGHAVDTQHSEPCFMYEAENGMPGGQDDQEAEPRSAEGSSTTHNKRHLQFTKQSNYSYTNHSFVHRYVGQTYISAGTLHISRYLHISAGTLHISRYLHISDGTLHISRYLTY